MYFATFKATTLYKTLQNASVTIATPAYLFIQPVEYISSHCTSQKWHPQPPKEAN